MSLKEVTIWWNRLQSCDGFRPSVPPPPPSSFPFEKERSREKMERAKKCVVELVSFTIAPRGAHRLISLCLLWIHLQVRLVVEAADKALIAAATSLNLLDPLFPSQDLAQRKEGNKIQAKS